MTDATPEQLDLARKIAAKALRDRKMPSPSYEAVDVEVGKYDEHSAVQSALAAIIETTERAAKLCEWPKEAPTNNEFARGMAVSCTINRDALRNQEHLKND